VYVHRRLLILDPDRLVFAQYPPVPIRNVEKVCEESGLHKDSIVMRMTGCPSGCARPYVGGYPVHLMRSISGFTDYCEQR